MSWTEERVEKLKKMWVEGQSASQIAKELGGVTRNAVIGKVHRLGLSNRSGGAASSDQGPKAKAKSAPKAQQPRKAAAKTASASAQPASSPQGPEPVSRAKSIVPASQPLPPQPSAHEIDPEAMAKFHDIEKKALKLSLMELTEKTCKWPIGDPATDDFWFCGLPVQPGKPYCEPCVGVAYQPMSTRRDRKR
ncbi:MAG: GcrA family cell cycle regulator [Pseudomonadota bacterium]